MNLRRQYPCDKHEGAVLKSEEDPSIRKILEGKTTLCWVNLHAEISIHVAQGGTTKTKIQFGSFRSLY